MKKQYKNIMKNARGGPGALGSNFLIVFNKKTMRNARGGSAELSGVIFLLFLIRKHNEKCNGRIRGALGSKSSKEMQ